MEIEVNGSRCEFPDGATVADVLDARGIARPGVAVAVNGEVVPRGAWPGSVVPKGASVDVLTAVQGG
ncbi:sulfur carrier protein ThiS [Amycolatopsis sp. PS_44_ISF1]|uniref:sulfur carrier protein ThiS n=1 Tax=Amycolatopsis sp. PS_44_ISF1 TaxID=2974917 RepID=UPI0028DF914F|nr:sulfur carrier protein ThiS [Amycolatopsis sp. PS_44_ISF1]MDT8911075.1 sulfur carrier protein ThiS [Amycolatopsis sp. PS_44_ISF1]